MERQLWPITKMSRAASTTSDETVWRLFTSKTRSIWVSTLKIYLKTQRAPQAAIEALEGP